MYDRTDIIQYFIEKNNVWSEFWQQWQTKERWTNSKLEQDYIEARYRFKLDMSFDEFVRSIEYDRDYKDSWQYRRKNRAPYPWKKETRYKKKPHHAIKELSVEKINKKEWRQKKKDRRDQGSRFYSGKYKKYVLRKGNRAERRYTKAKIKSTNWTEYGLTVWYGESNMIPFYALNEWDNYINKSKRYWVNPWDWD